MRRFMDFRLHFNEESVLQAPTSEPLCVPPDATVRQALGLLKEKQTGSVMVCENDRVIGIFTERDALRVMAQMATDTSQQGVLDRPIRESMTSPVTSLTPGSSMQRAISMMSIGGYRRMPIVDEQGRPVAELKVSGVLRYLVTHFPTIIYTLPPQPRHAAHAPEGA
jgi:CBS domain-containing protein